MVQQAKKDGRLVQFASFLALCNLKHSKLAAHPQTYSGESCSVGDNVNDDRGHRSVFAEQGASASQMAAGRFLDTISRLLARQAKPTTRYQCIRRYKCQKHQTHALSEKECTTGVDKTTSRRTKQWDSIEESMVPLDRNLYGHPMAGILSERKLEEVLLKHNLGKVSTWECLSAHRKSQMFLPVHVDDIKMVGKENVGLMWRKRYRLEGTDPWLNQTFLCCTQRQTVVGHHAVQAKADLFRSHHDRGDERGAKQQ